MSKFQCKSPSLFSSFFHISLGSYKDQKQSFVSYTDQEHRQYTMDTFSTASLYPNYSECRYSRTVLPHIFWVLYWIETYFITWEPFSTNSSHILRQFCDEASKEFIILYRYFWTPDKRWYTKMVCNFDLEIFFSAGV